MSSIPTWSKCLRLPRQPSFTPRFISMSIFDISFMRSVSIVALSSRNRIFLAQNSLDKYAISSTTSRASLALLFHQKSGTLQKLHRKLHPRLDSIVRTSIYSLTSNNFLSGIGNPFISNVLDSLAVSTTSSQTLYAIFGIEFRNIPLQSSADRSSLIGFSISFDIMTSGDTLFKRIFIGAYVESFHQIITFTGNFLQSSTSSRSFLCDQSWNRGMW